MWDAQIALIGAVANLADLGRAGEHNGGSVSLFRRRVHYFR